MFKIESYITPILLSYVDKYVKDFKPADAQVSLWGGGVVLHNLVLKTDVVQQEVPLPFTLVSGRIHELLIQVPWTKIMSEPIVVTIDTIECILNPRLPSDQPMPETPSGAPQVVEAPPGYMQALVRRIVSNIAIKIHHLIVKYVQDDIVLSLNVKHLLIDTTNATWEPTFADIEVTNPAIRRLIVLDDLTLCLDSTDSDGKIRFYQDPLLYRCGLEFRVLARLVSANTRRASSFDIQMRTTKLAWGVTNDQLVLLLRLLKEKVQKIETPSPKSEPSKMTFSVAKSTTSIPTLVKQPLASPSNAAEPARRESWSDWAWSWKPSTSSRGGSKEAIPVTACPTPIQFSAYLNEVLLVVKTRETDASNRKRFRSLLELSANFAAAKCWICIPTLMRAKIGIRSLELKSFGKCCCGHYDYNSAFDEPTVYISTIKKQGNWSWPDEQGNREEEAQETISAEAKVTESKSSEEETVKSKEPDAEEEPQNGTQNIAEQNTEGKEPGTSTQESPKEKKTTESETSLSDEIPFIKRSEPRGDALNPKDAPFWKELSPIIFLEFYHERSPPGVHTNPYDNPPKNFEYSDWEEDCNIQIQVEPMDFRICMGLIHRLIFIKDIYAAVPPPPIEPMRVLTVEECDALNQNLPQQRINIQLTDFRVNVHPWDHSTTEKPVKSPIVLRIEIPKGVFVITKPLYAQRVCSAAGQMPNDKGILWQGCQMHTTAVLNSIKISVCSTIDELCKPCGRINLRFITHMLLFPEYFVRKQSIVFSYAVKISEANISGSAARLHAAVQIATSLMNENVSLPLRHTSLAKDALADEDLVALDVTAEDLSTRGFVTTKSTTYILTLQSLRATVFQSAPGKELQQAWVFSGPDIPTSVPYIRFGAQFCSSTFPGSVEFIGLWTEPTALAIDPLFASWLAYTPSKLYTDLSSQLLKTSSAQVFTRRAPSSSGRGQSRSGTASAEQVHSKTRSLDSSTELSEKKEMKESQSVEKEPPVEPWWKGQNLLKMHERLKTLLIYVELGLVLLYVTTKTATAVGYDTVRLAMEQHAIQGQDVVVYSIGRWIMQTTSVTKHLWQFIQQDGPTYYKPKQTIKDTEKRDSFPWQLLLGDMSCYTLEVDKEVEQDRISQTDVPMKKQSRLKITTPIRPCTILELVSTNVVLSVVTKTLQHKVVVKKFEPEKKHLINKKEAILKYFTAGEEFKPTTCIEFIRGPAHRKKAKGTQSTKQEDAHEEVSEAPAPKAADNGPIVSLGFNLHADTPPVVIRIEFEKVQPLALSLHCIGHVIALLMRNPMHVPKRFDSYQAVSSRTMTRSEVDENETKTSHSEDKLKTIYTSIAADTEPINTFIWFQWVTNRITAVITFENTKLATDIDQVSVSIDLPENYRQLKIKIASISVRQFELSEESMWVPTACDGRVLEVREPLNALEDINFLSVTITAAQISHLPVSWQEELHPKLIEQKDLSDNIWEIYAVLAPLEVVIIPKTFNNIALLANSVSRKSCPTPKEEERTQATYDLPYCYLSAGGLVVLIACDVENNQIDDTFLFSIGKTSINPHPDNPICRQPVSTTDVGWNASPNNFEGRQYELIIKGISLGTTQLSQLETQSTPVSKITNDNPAVKWSTPVPEANITSILHSLNIDLLLAPPLCFKETILCGWGIELNITSDCIVDFNLDQLFLIEALKKLVHEVAPDNMAIIDENGKGECPYAMILQRKDSEDVDLKPSTLFEDDNPRASVTTFSGTVDSGMETATTHSTYKSSPLKKTVSIATEQRSRSSDYVEVLITMGLFEVSLYTLDDDSEDMRVLREFQDIPQTNPDIKSEKRNKEEFNLIGTESNTIRYMDFGITELDAISKKVLLLSRPKCIPLLLLMFHQPNLYYWKRRSQTNLQVSLFNIWFGLNFGTKNRMLRTAILTTARGEIDPVTEIPPSLFTMKYTSGGCGTFLSTVPHGNLNIDIERPILVDISEEVMVFLIRVFKMIRRKLPATAPNEVESQSQQPMLYTIRQFFVDKAVEVVNIQTSQIGITLAKLTFGVDGITLQLSLNNRRDQMTGKGLVTALLLSADNSNFTNLQPILHPMHIGIQLNASWEAWQRAAGGPLAKEPSVWLLFDMDCVTFDLMPENLVFVKNMLEILNEWKEIQKEKGSSVNIKEGEKKTDMNEENFQPTTSMLDAEDAEDHYYHDDLRSGAFQIVRGGQMPMAYQVTLHKDVISWRYPHPRAIINLVAYPLPYQNQEVKCVLEFYSSTLNKWEPYITIQLPVAEPREIGLHDQPPEIVFSSIWRFRAVADTEPPNTYQFNMRDFLPNTESSKLEDKDPVDVTGLSDITAEELSGILRVDSYFAPRQTPRHKVSVRCSKLDVYAHNSLPQVNTTGSIVDGYYLCKPLIRSHHALGVCFQDAELHLHSGASAGSVAVFQTHLSSEIFACESGIMQPLTDSVKVQVALSIPENVLEASRIRMCTTNIRLALHLSRFRTLQMLAGDWQQAYETYVAPKVTLDIKDVKPQQEIRKDVYEALEGRIFMWVHNSCTVPLRMGQEGTDEIFPLEPGTRLAYRWRSPTAKQRLRFSVVNPMSEWRWSHCVTFAVAETRVRLEGSEYENIAPGGGVFLYISIKQFGAHRIMRLSGRVIVANMLRLDLLYRIRERQFEGDTWKTISSGELNNERISPSIISSTDREMVLKVKFKSHDTGWSGDIPLKECPKENVPWLVKVPSQGDVPYISVWCRVVRARFDGRIFAAIWPLYVLRSSLTLDTDVLIVTVMDDQSPPSDQRKVNFQPLIQTAPGRGAKTHLLPPGTTSAKHSLTFQYRNVECPVTREAIPLHYGVTDTSVFDKRIPVHTIAEVINETIEWFSSSRHEDPNWPNSIVSKHWKGKWQPALLQPRCDVAVRYQAVRVGGGGCCLEVQLCPVLLLCNAAPLAITLRAHDAAPVCRIEPGNIISLPAILLKKPFFLSFEKERDTFVSEQLEVCSTEPGRYGAPPPGQIAVDHPATFAIPYHDQVMILNMHYEIKDDINIMGVTSVFNFVNNLDFDVRICIIALDTQDKNKEVLEVKSFEIVQSNTGKSIQYVPLVQFQLQQRWRSGGHANLAKYLIVGPATTDTDMVYHITTLFTVPVKLGAAPHRRPLALYGADRNSIAVVLTQHKCEGRWIVTLSPDPCPQYFIKNMTSYHVSIAQAHPPKEDSNDSTVNVMKECAGVFWYCQLGSNASSYYSGPGYTFDRAVPTECPPPEHWLTFGHYRLQEEPNWCPPVAMTAGVQLVQLSEDITIKMRVHPYPHSTLVELQDVEITDISASEIRKRLTDRMSISTSSTSSTMPKNDVLLTPVSRIKKFLNSEKINLAMRQEDMNQLEQKLIDYLQKSKESRKFNKFEDDSMNKVNMNKILLSNITTPANDRHTQQPEQSVKILKEDLQMQQPEKPVTTSEKNPQIQEERPVTIPENDPQIQEKKPVTIPEKDPRKQEENPVTIPEEDPQIQEEKPVTIPENDPQTQHPETPDTTTEKGPQMSLINVKINTTPVEIDTTSLPTEFISLAGQALSYEIEESKSLNPEENFEQLQADKNDEWKDNTIQWADNKHKVVYKVECMVTSMLVELGANYDTLPLLAVHFDRTHFSISTLYKRMQSTLSISDIQIDNLQYESGQYDFAVIATTRAVQVEPDSWPSIWNMFTEHGTFFIRRENNRVMVKLSQDTWDIQSFKFRELSEIVFHAGPLALYIEDAYIAALVALLKQVSPRRDLDQDAVILAEARALQNPLRLRLLHIQPIDVTLTLHTAVRMYIALDQSPLRLNEFKVQHMFTSSEYLAHALTVHYLSAAILSAGWVVGGLELLGAPGALAARVGGATGGVRGVAFTTAAALLRSLSACAGSLARNLDLLAGDEEHARRAAAARRRPPATFVGGLLAGFTNFAINILGAVGGLAHHPLVGVAVGETGSSAAALRRSLLGALTKPLSATADLVAFAGHGLLTQAGWNPVPQPRTPRSYSCEVQTTCWRRDCVRWNFRLSEFVIIAGFEVLLNGAPLQLLLTHEFIMLAEAGCERVVEMIDLNYCTIGTFVDGIITIYDTKCQLIRTSESRGLNEDEFQISETAMQRVARYTGAEGGSAGEARVVSIVPAKAQGAALHAALLTLVHAHADSHFALL